MKEEGGQGKEEDVWPMRKMMIKLRPDCFAGSNQPKGAGEEGAAARQVAVEEGWKSATADLCCPALLHCVDLLSQHKWLGLVMEELTLSDTFML